MMTTTMPRALLLLAALAAAGCSKTATCRDGTVLYHLSLSARGAAATAIDVTTRIAGTTRTDSGTRPARAQAAVELTFPAGYPAGQAVDVKITLRDGAGVAAEATDHFTVTGGCLARNLTVPDLLGGDGGGAADTLMSDAAGDGPAATDARDAGADAGCPDGPSELAGCFACGRSCGGGECSGGECRPWVLNPVAFAYPVDWFTVYGSTVYAQMTRDNAGEDIVSLPNTGGTPTVVVGNYGKLQGPGERIMADAQNVYYYEAGGKYFNVKPLDGSTPPSFTGHSFMQQPLLAGAYLLFIDEATHALWRVDKSNGANPMTLVPSGIAFEYASPAIAADGDRVYLVGASQRSLQWVPLAGGAAPVTLYGSSLYNLTQVSAAAGTVFAATPDSVVLVQYGGATRNQVVYRDPPNLVAYIAADRDALYLFVGTVTDTSSMRAVPSALLRLRVGETTPTKIADVAGTGPMYQAVVDGDSVYYAVGPRLYRVMK